MRKAVSLWSRELAAVIVLTFVFSAVLIIVAPIFLVCGPFVWIDRQIKRSFLP